jgi:16S rRNA (adenine1518-N6/adenine1519-N6)-dimethyltransferase
MLPLTAPRRVKALLERHGLHADKRFGQNFLIDASALARIVDSADITTKDTVCDVGAGLGVLTYELAQRAKQVISVEVDDRLVAVLAETLATCNNVTLWQQDALTVDWQQLPEGCLFVANLPYNVATPLLREVLASQRFVRAVCLVQKEVAERLAASPSTPAYGALSLWTQYYAAVTIVRHVKPSAFLPPPKVTSSIVRLDIHQRAPAPVLFRLIEDSFKHRRKTLKKNLRMAGYDETHVSNVFEELGLDARIRAEALNLATFEMLVTLL